MSELLWYLMPLCLVLGIWFGWDRGYEAGRKTLLVNLQVTGSELAKTLGQLGDARRDIRRAVDLLANPTRTSEASAFVRVHGGASEEGGKR